MQTKPTELKTCDITFCLDFLETLTSSPSFSVLREITQTEPASAFHNGMAACLHEPGVDFSHVMTGVLLGVALMAGSQDETLREHLLGYMHKKAAADQGNVIDFGSRRASNQNVH